MGRYMKIVYKKIHEIKPYARNPRVNNKTVDELCKMIPKVGFNVPLVIDQNGVIIKGHARFKAAIRLGMTELPCIISEADGETNKLDRIADNRVIEFSEWDRNKLFEEISGNEFEDLLGAKEEDEQEPQKDISVSEAIPAEEKPEREVIRYAKCACHNCGAIFFVSEKEVEND